ncbi:MAG: PA2779 family protein [Gammaproteobacteria bacterium]|nr:PA2779 family protein [Gammaproteobacteria bacterium]
MNGYRYWVKRTIVLSVTASMLSLGLATQVNAAIIGTGDVIQVERRAELLSQVDSFLIRADVRNQLERLGVDAAEAQLRAQAMTNEELTALSANIDQFPAGGGVLEVIGVVFVVLLILEIVGVIDIFKRT